MARFAYGWRRQKWKQNKTNEKKTQPHDKRSSLKRALVSTTWWKPCDLTRCHSAAEPRSNQSACKTLEEKRIPVVGMFLQMDLTRMDSFAVVIPMIHSYSHFILWSIFYCLKMEVPLIVTKKNIPFPKRSVSLFSSLNPSQNISFVCNSTGQGFTVRSECKAINRLYCLYWSQRGGGGYHFYTLWYQLPVAGRHSATRPQAILATFRSIKPNLVINVFKRYYWTLG